VDLAADEVLARGCKQATYGSLYGSVANCILRGCRQAGS
jgi:hypothetical protein